MLVTEDAQPEPAVPIVVGMSALDAPVGLPADGVENIDPLEVASGPKRLTHYVLLEKLGHGGMGVVYAAYDERLDRKVAIKLLRSDPERNAADRLIREGQAMARVSHPNVVQIYEIGEITGRIFVVMEFVEGVTLRAWLSEKRRSRRDVVGMFVAAGRGLAAAHAEGLVHRDFKPDNVMIDVSGRARVMDFGIARGEDDDEDDDEDPADPADAKLGPRVGLSQSNSLASVLTAAGDVMGTLAYMSPEQLEGRPIDTRSDQFSFCVALWEAVFETRPFEGSSVEELSELVSTGTFSRPDRSDVPGWLRKLLRRGLEPDPERRWPSMTELLDALERDPSRRRWALVAALMVTMVVVGVVVASVVSRESVAWDHSRALADASTCVLAGRAIEDEWNAEVRSELAGAFDATGLSFARTTWARTSEWMDTYASEWSQLRTKTCLDVRSAGGQQTSHQAGIALCLDERRANFAALIDAWTEADGQTVTLALTAAASLPPVSRCTNERWRAQSVPPPDDRREDVTKLRAQLNQAAALRMAGKFDAGLAVAQATLGPAQALNWRPLEAETRLAIGRLEDELGDYTGARRSLEAAYLAAVGGGHDQLALEAVTRLTLVVGDKLTQPEPGLLWGHLGLMYIERLQLEGSFLEAEVLYAVGLIHDHLGDYASARRSLERALAIDIEELGPDHPAVARQLNGLGGVYWAEGAYEDALDTQIRSLEIVKTALGLDHPEVGRSLNNMGIVLSALGKHERALKVQLEALEIRKAALGPDHPDVAATLNAIGSSMAVQGEHELSLASHRRALEILEVELGPDHVAVATTLNDISSALIELGEPDEALAKAERALGVIETAFGPEHAELALPLTNMGRAFAQQGQPGLARQSLARALAIRELALGPDHSLVAESRGLLESLD